MDHESRVVRIDHENDLEQPPGLGPTPDEKLLIVLGKWKRSPGAKNDLLCLFGLDVVPANVFFVPVVPSELHGSRTELFI
jgi:hypothetical protein